MTKKGAFESQFDNSLKITNCFLILSGIKIYKQPWNKFLEHFVNHQLFYYDLLILHTVIFGEIYGVIDCIQTGKSLVKLSLNLPCITICALATVKIIFLHINRRILIDVCYKLKEIHCENDKGDFVDDDFKRKIVSKGVKILRVFVLLFFAISVIVIAMFCIVPVLLMAYDYQKTGVLEVIYPFIVKYPYFEVYKSSWWPLIYFHQVLASEYLIIFLPC